MRRPARRGQDGQRTHWFSEKVIYWLLNRTVDKEVHIGEEDKRERKKNG